MCRVLCSTGALIGLANNRNYRLLDAVAGRLACDGYEFMMYGSWYEEAERIVEYLQSLKLEIPVMHCEKRIGERISKGESAEAFRLFETVILPEIGWLTVSWLQSGVDMV